MRRKKEIDEWALDYWLLQRYAKLCFRIYYRKIQFLNKGLIPRNQPVIIAPNHQNALMDAMALVTQTNLQSVFLARADIFKGKFMIRFLTFLNIMPVFRIRDGIENVKKNDEVFEKTTRVLHNRINPLVIFPEGSHGDRRRLRPLVKGLFRIAFQAQEKFGSSPGVKIVPVGIDYGHYQNFGTTLFINVGKPIEISGFYNDYTDNPVMAVNRLKDIYAEQLSKLIIDIQNEEYYPLYLHLREIFNDQMRSILNIRGKSLHDKFQADKVMIDILDKELETAPENIKTLNDIVLPYQNTLRQAGLRDHTLKERHNEFIGLASEALMMILLSPLFLFGSINNALPYWFTASRVTKIKDLQFHSSFKYVTGMLTFPAWYLVIAGVMALLGLSVWSIVLYILLLPLTGLIAFDYFIRLRKFLSRLRFLFRKKSEAMSSLIQRRKMIFDLMSDIINRHKISYEN